MATHERPAESTRDGGVGIDVESYEAPDVVVGEYTWEDFKYEYYYDETGAPPRDDDGEIVPFDPAAYLGFDPAELPTRLGAAARRARGMLALEDERTATVNPDLDEDAFFSNADGTTTVANRYDMEKALTMEQKRHYEEVERYWVNKPYAFVVVFHSVWENEDKYVLVEPYTNDQERAVADFFTAKLRNAIRYSGDDVVLDGTPEERRAVIEETSRELLRKYRLTDDSNLRTRAKDLIGGLFSTDEPVEQSASPTDLDGLAARPEPAVLAAGATTLTAYEVEKLLYYLRRDFVGYGPIDGVKHDVSVEDISCDGYDGPVFVYHAEYEQLITNVTHDDRADLDDFVVKLAQRSGKGISKRNPQVDATLPDGSRAQLTLGREVSDHGTNYTIRQFKDVPFTPVDLINWNTFSLDEMAYLWLCIENDKSLIFAGGTASGKTTSLNAVSLFIPSNAKIVSIEDTREVELPQRNWVANVTRPSFSADETGSIDEFDLLEAALRQRPDYIVMGEVRGEEGRTLFQVMSTGHTTLTTFHADSVDEVIKRFTTDPINVSKTLFTALDLVSVQTQTRVGGRKVRRAKTLTEIGEYDAENDDVAVQDVYQWQAETDQYLKQGSPRKLEEIAFDRGWTRDRIERELTERRLVLAYLIDRGLNDYAQVAATVQAYINDPEAVLTLMANDELDARLSALRKMQSVVIDVDPETEELVPRPEPTPAVREVVADVLERNDHVLATYRGREPSGLASALPATDQPLAPAGADGGRPVSLESDGGVGPEGWPDERDEWQPDDHPTTGGEE